MVLLNIAEDNGGALESKMLATTEFSGFCDSLT